jgi:SdpI/YfhL protein family
MLLTVLLLIVIVLIAVAAIPLGLGVVPQNPYYGLNTERTSAKEKTWVRANMFVGRVVVGACALSAFLIMFYQGTWLRSGWAQFAAFVIPMAGAIVAVILYEKRLPR